MNAPTAMQSHTTLETSNIATASGASSTIPLRIDSFIKDKFARADSVDFSGIKHTATKLEGLGFRSCANSRYAEYLEGFLDTPHLRTRYEERYPNSFFLPWRAFHSTLKSLDLWCDLPEFYAGAVPDEQIPWIEVFELQDDDRPDFRGARGLVEEDLRFWQIVQSIDIYYGVQSGERSMFVEDPLENWQRIARLATNEQRQSIHSLWKQMRDSLFVVAPKEAFNSTEDWITRFRKLVSEVKSEPTIAPNDPLVIRFVNGGALVIAAWGDEAAHLNQVTRDLGI